MSLPITTFINMLYQENTYLDIYISKRPSEDMELLDAVFYKFPDITFFTRKGEIGFILMPGEINTVGERIVFQAGNKNRILIFNHIKVNCGIEIKTYSEIKFGEILYSGGKDIHIGFSNYLGVFGKDSVTISSYFRDYNKYELYIKQINETLYNYSNN